MTKWSPTGSTRHRREGRPEVPDEGFRGAAGLHAGGHHLPAARLLGPHRPAASVDHRRHRQREPAPLLLQRRSRAEGDQAPARRRSQTAAGPPGRRMPPRRPRVAIWPPRSWSWSGAGRCWPIPTATSWISWPGAKACSTSCRCPASSPSSRRPSSRSSTDTAAADAKPRPQRPSGGRLPGIGRGRRALSPTPRPESNPLRPGDPVRPRVRAAVRPHPRLLRSRCGSTSRSSSPSTGTSDGRPTAGLPSRLLASRARALRRGHHPQPTAGDEEERQGPPAGASSIPTCGSPSCTSGTPWPSWPSTAWPATGVPHRSSPAPPEHVPPVSSRRGRHPDGARRTSRRSERRPLRHTALIDAHRRLGAKLVEFGGWEMPLSYRAGPWPSTAPAASDAVVFDVSHLGTVRVEGADAFDRLQAALSNDLRRIGPGRAQYTHLLDDADGSVVDDIIVWWLSDERLRRDAQRLQHPTGSRRPSAGRTPPVPLHHRRPGPPRPDPAGHRRPRGRRGAPVRGRPVRLGGRALRGRRHRVHRRGRRRVRRARRRRRRPVDGAARQPASSPPGSGPATPCASRPALPLHGHELGPGHHPAAGRPGLGGRLGQDRLPRPRRPWPPNGNAGCPATWSAWPPTGASPRARGRRCSEGRPAGRDGDQRELLAHARARDRPGPRRRPRSTPSRRWSSTSSSGAGRPGHRGHHPLRPGRPVGDRRADRPAWPALGLGARPQLDTRTDQHWRRRPVGTYIPHTDDEVATHAGLPRPLLGRRAVRRGARGPPAPARPRVGRRRGRARRTGRHGGPRRPEPGPLRPAGLLRRRWRLRPRDPFGDPGPGRSLRVRHLLHALPARGGPGRAAGHLRVPDHGGPADRAAGGQRLPVRRRQCRRRGGQPGRGRLGPRHGVGVRRHPSPLAPDAGHLRRRDRASAA